MPNRSVSPPITPIKNLKIPTPKTVQLDNGIPVYLINLGTQDVVKADIVFLAGRPFEKKKLASRATINLLKEGSANFSGSEIAEELDYFGSTLNFPVSLDTSSLSLFTLSKHFERMMVLISDILRRPIFPEDQLDRYKNNSKQRLLLDMAQPDVVAYRAITEYLFGKEHPYGYNSLPELYDELHRSDIVEHWSRCFSADNCKIIVSGKVNDKMLATINQHIGTLPFSKSKLEKKFPLIQTGSPQKIKIEMPNTVQTSIRIGRRLFNKHHEDFKGLMVLNTIIGGYFGSRLMTNVREEKGYTYNIFSTIDSLHNDGYFYIGSEVGNEYVEQATNEIYKELERLRDIEIGKEELQMVRNYMLGNLLTMLDGPFNVSNVINTIVSENLSFDDFDALVETIQTITPKTIRALARKYFSPSELWEINTGS